MSTFQPRDPSRSISSPKRRMGNRTSVDGVRKKFTLTHPELWKAYREDSGQETRNRLVVEYHAFAREIVRRFSGRLPVP